MKRKNRDLNVFSMSALDLFASALGAFILLAVVFLPFFPNTGDSPIMVENVLKDLAEKSAELDDTKDKLKSAEDENDKLKGDLEEAEAAAAANPFPDLDLVIVIDTTGSMSEKINGLRRDITEITNLLRKAAPSVGIGIVEFKDRCDPARQTSSFGIELVHGGTMARVQNFADGLTAGGGCNDDTPEAAKAGLDKAISMNWRSDAKLHQIVLLTDALPYDDELESTIRSVEAFVNTPGKIKRRVSPVAVKTGNNSDSYDAVRAYYQRVADAGKSKLVEDGASFAITLLLATIGAGGT